MREFSSRRWLALLAGCLALGVVGCGEAEPPKKRIVILTNTDSPYWDACRQGVLMDVNTGADEGQINMLRQYGTQSDVVAVGISAYRATNSAVADEMRKLQEKGIHVIAVDNDVDRSKFRDARFAFVGTDNLKAGRELGVAIRNLRPEGGEVVTFVGSRDAQNATDRVHGIEEGIGEKFKLTDNMEDSVDKSRAQENVRDAIKNHPKLNVLAGIYSYNGPAIADIVRRMDRRKDFTVVTFDAEPQTIRDMASGDMDCMVVQDPYKIGYDSVRLMKALVENDTATIESMFPNKGKEPDGDVYTTNLKVVVPNDESPLKADMFEKTTEFLTLGAFKSWLTKLGLNGS
jgi:ribose transport system substrate-binding protein